MGFPVDFTPFGMFGILFFLMFLVFIAVFISIAVKALKQWNKNNHSPRLTVPASIVAKRTHVSHSGGGVHDHHHHTHTSYYVTFQVDSGDRMEFSVPSTEYGLLIESDRGELSFQGTRFLGFCRK